jgi:hypothetical protein
LKNISDKSCRETQNTFDVQHLFFENYAIYEIMWKNVEKGTPQMTIRRIRIACWIPKAPNTHVLCNTHCFSAAKMVA